jgi:pyroglutamyl-peptidase
MSGLEVSLTGFRIFGDVAKNPTEEIVEHFMSHQSSATHSTGAGHSSHSSHSIPSQAFKSLEVLDVSIRSVDEYMDRSQSHAHTNQSKQLIIHLGVNQGASQFKIENYAYNNKTFRIPDNDGAMPLGECIDSTNVFDAPLKTSFPTEAILEALQKENINVGVSSDPGRYLCNYVYYKSLSSLPVNASADIVFIHTPPDSVYPIATQVHVVERVIQLWKKQCAEASSHTVESVGESIHA